MFFRGVFGGGDDGVGGVVSVEQTKQGLGGVFVVVAAGGVDTFDGVGCVFVVAFSTEALIEVDGVGGPAASHRHISVGAVPGIGG